MALSRRLVPPQASAYGLDAGKSAWAFPSDTRSPLPLSPAAVVTVTPSAAASANAWSSAARAWPVQESSDWPQLMLTAVGVGLGVYRRGDRVHEAAVTVGREVDDLLRARCRRAGDLNVQQHLPVRALRVPAGHVRRAVHA